MPASRRAIARDSLDPNVAAVRRFNRFYTQRIGVLREGWGKSRFSLTQSRVLYEIQARDNPTATEIARELGLDAGYLSRILRGFETRSLIARETSEHDGRQSFLSLTASGRKAYAPIEQYTNDEVGALIAALSESGQRQLIDAMQTIETLMTPEQTGVPYILRPPRPGDFGWVAARHGVIYATEYGWDERIEALCAEIVAAYVRNHDPKKECCWIAERNGVNIGCVFLVKEDDETARLRLLLVDPQARGLGIGTRLVEECLRFSRRAGYRRVTLWTHRVLEGARKIYIAAGFKLTREWTHDDFGKTLVAETWELEL
jgi:DNA-binding MarR family transcriptional regulator/GNAT superfamily N-acetyltransferase